MKNKEMQRLAKDLLFGIPSFVIKPPLLLHAPLRHTLKAVCFDSHSRDARQFYLEVFLLPMFLPEKHISYMFGKRIGNGSWCLDDPSLSHKLEMAFTDDILPFLQRVETPADMARVAEEKRHLKNPHVQRAIAYSWARAGELKRSLDELQMLFEMLDIQVQWQNEIAENARILKKKLMAGAEETQRQLDEWELETLRNLKLAKFRQ